MAAPCRRHTRGAGRRAGVAGACRLTGESHVRHLITRVPTLLPSGWMAVGWRAMAATFHELRPKAGDSEKITINLGFVDLGQIDLLVAEGFYANRTDLIRTAIRNQLDRHADAVKGSVARK